MIETERKEKMNELMNKISLSLKDANLQQGFEIICQRIAELEKENEDLKKENGGLKAFIAMIENLLKISQETQEESSKRILEQQKTIGSLKDTIDELKAQVENEKEAEEYTTKECCTTCKAIIGEIFDMIKIDITDEIKEWENKLNF